MIDLRGKTALVTGGGRRVGAAIARALGAQGMRVAVHYHDSRDGAQITCEAIAAAGGEAFSLQADLYDRPAARRLVDEALRRLSGLDLLVLNAANFERVRFEEIDDLAWDRAMSLNLSSSFTVAHRATPALRESGGSIVFVTCTSATIPFRHYLPYVVSKGAVQKLMRVMALELAPEVRVNAVAPGTVLPPEGMDPAIIAKFSSEIPLGRDGVPTDVADAVLYLARAPFVTGQEIIVDGGRTVGTAD